MVTVAGIDIQCYYSLERYEFNYFPPPPAIDKTVEQTGLLNLDMATNLGERKLRI